MNVITMSKNETSKRSTEESADLGIGLLVLEADGGLYQPVAPVSTIREAREMAEYDLGSRRESLAKGADPPCPTCYRVWARDERGGYVSIAEIEVGWRATAPGFRYQALITTLLAIPSGQVRAAAGRRRPM
ncbi:MAG: hypothetical protein JWN34_2057 [Bryobacterales bacterium]|nr:hypothetical protein [Bryobacterales bacterium]